MFLFWAQNLSLQPREVYLDIVHQTPQEAQQHRVPVKRMEKENMR